MNHVSSCKSDPRTERSGGVTGIYEFSRKMKVVGSTNKDGGFRAMLHYLFRFD